MFIIVLIYTLLLIGVTYGLARGAWPNGSLQAYLPVWVLGGLFGQAIGSCLFNSLPIWLNFGAIFLVGLVCQWKRLRPRVFLVASVVACLITLTGFVLY